jgi:N-acyl-D-amino-acid deacylase
MVLMAGLTLAGAGRADDSAEKKPTQKSTLPVTGDAGEGLEHFDQLLLQILEKEKIPGASLAIARDGRLVLARSYGYADLAKKDPVRPTSLFNLASCTKAFIGAAVLRLVDDRKLKLDDRAFRLLKGIKPLPGDKLDPRLGDVTVRQMLHHAGGLASGPGASSKQIAKRFKSSLPITLEQLTAFSLGKPLLFDPGTRSRYSNLSFLILRLVIQQASGQDHERYTTSKLLRPMGIRAMRTEHQTGYAPGEVVRHVDLFQKY